MWAIYSLILTYCSSLIPIQSVYITAKAFQKHNQFQQCQTFGNGVIWQATHSVRTHAQQEQSRLEGTCTAVYVRTTAAWKKILIYKIRNDIRQCCCIRRKYWRVDTVEHRCMSGFLVIFLAFYVCWLLTTSRHVMSNVMSAVQQFQCRTYQWGTTSCNVTYFMEEGSKTASAFEV